MRLFLLSLLTAAPLLPSALASEEEATVGIDISLVSDVSTVAPAKPFNVALKIHHHDGYHTYWKSPGIVGVPFAVDWKLPPGFKAGEIQWPAPQLVDMAGHPAHGYQRDLMLLVEITPPATLSGATVDLSGNASWMACEKGCNPEEKTLSLHLPVAAEAVSGRESEAIKNARAEIPRPLAGWEVMLESARDAEEIQVKFTRTADPATDLGKIYFFSSDGQISSDPPQKIEVLPDGFRLIAPRAKYGPQGKTTLPGVLVTEKPLADGGKAFASVEPSYK